MRFQQLLSSLDLTNLFFRFSPPNSYSYAEIFNYNITEDTVIISDAASGCSGWALAHPEFWSSVNPITTRGADYAHHITASPPVLKTQQHLLKDLIF